jgi:CelD/BcsL family acetyltransferase involved in cellulose biosynthesis
VTTTGLDPRSPSPALSVVTTAEGFSALRAPWDDLLGRSQVASPFMSFEWLHTWWKHYGGGQELRVVVARHGEQVIGILPIYLQIQRVMKFKSVRIARFIGTGGDTTPDDLDALLHPEHATQAANAFAKFIAESLGGWDVLRLTDMTQESPFRMALEAVLGARWGASLRCGTSARISYLPLPARWNDYVESLSRQRRYTVKKTRRRVHEESAGRFFLWDDLARLDEAIDRLIVLHNLRWDAKGQDHAFSSPAYNAFHREVMRACQERGWLRLYCLQVGDSIAAMSYCYRFRDQVFYFQGGFDPALAKLRPGLVLMGHAIEHAIEEGNRIFDMLRGQYEFKSQWATEHRTTFYCQAYRPGLASLCYRARYEWPQALRRRFAREPAPAPAPSPAED